MAKRKTRKTSTAKRGKTKTVRKAAGGKSARKSSKRKVAKTTRKKAVRTTRTRSTGKGAARKSSKKVRGARSKTTSSSKPVRKRFRSAALVEQSFQIHCEAQMLRSVVSLLTGDGSGGRPARVEDRAHRNALNESFCLHFRTLLDFFWEGRAGKKEAVARDFFATPRRWKPAKPQDYRDLKKRLAKEIDALTTTRYRELSIEEWPYRKIFDQIFVDIERFRTTAPQEGLHECWRERPVASLSGESAQSSTFAAAEAADSEVNERKAVEKAVGATAALLAGSVFSGAESPRPDWSSTTEDGEELDESKEEASVFARDFSTLGLDDD